MMSQYVTSKIHTTKKDIYVVKHNLDFQNMFPKVFFGTLNYLKTGHKYQFLEIKKLSNSLPLAKLQALPKVSRTLKIISPRHPPI